MNTIFLSQLQAAHEAREFALFIKNLAASGELFNIIPELKGLDQVPQDPRWHPEGDVWTHTMLVLENLPSEATFAMSLAALFHDVGKATTTVIHESGGISARGHEDESRKIAAKILADLGADSELQNDVLFLVFRHMIAHSKEANKRTLKRLILEGGVDLVDQLLLHGVADVKSGCKDFTDCIRLRELFDSLREAPLELERETCQ